jgi:X-linked retinitis pigmentosa GTPase regulator
MEVDGPQLYLLGKTYLTNNENFYIRNDPIVHIAAGDRHTIIVTESGRAYAFGDNNSGRQRGFNRFCSISFFKISIGQLGLGHAHAVERVSCIKSLKFGETGEKIILAACGRESSLVATNQGSLYAFGLNLCCQLGLESEESITIHFSPVKIEYFRSKMSWKQLAMGAEHTCVLTNDGQVYVWGSNEVGQCGLEHKYEIIKAPNELKLEYSVNAM